jgi:hypothetical protein
MTVSGKSGHLTAKKAISSAGTQVILIVSRDTPRHAGGVPSLFGVQPLVIPPDKAGTRPNPGPESLPSKSPFSF